MATTSNYGITLVEQAQAQKEVTINQAFAALDAIVGNQVADKDLATPPGSPTAGVMYIVAASSTGAWAGKATQLTYFDQIWRFIVPQTGMRVWVMDELLHYRFDGTNWIAITAGGGSTITKGTAVLDFGAFPGNNEASVAVTGQTGILATHQASAAFRHAATADHSINDHAYAAALAELTCTVPIAGTGFTITARSEQKLQGTFNLNWNWF